MIRGKEIDAALLLLRSCGAGGRRLAAAERQIRALYRLTEGTVWDTQEDSGTEYRKTVPDGAKAAEIGSIGGSSAVWNQLVRNGDFSQDNGWTGLRCDISYGADGATLTCTSEGNVAAFVSTAYQRTFPAHRYLVLADITASKTDNYRIALSSSITSNYAAFSAEAGEAVRVKALLTISEALQTMPRIGSARAMEVGDMIELRGLYVIDLTLLFGAGNEPETVNDPRVAGIETYAYSHPAFTEETLISADVSRIVSRSSDDTLLDALDIPAGVRLLEGYGQSAPGGSGNTLDLTGGTFTEIGHYVNGVWTLLDTPRVTDISAMLPGTLTAAAAGGTLTFEQEGGTTLQVPNTVDYLIRLSEVTA